MGRVSGSRAVVTGSLAVLALTWIWWVVDPTAPDTTAQPVALTTLLAANIVITILVPRLKRALVAFIQRWLVNPVVRALFRIGFVPFGFALLETRGRKSGEPRHTPVSNGLVGSTFWVIAEHGSDAHYVRNLIADPRVRVRCVKGSASYGWMASPPCCQVMTRAADSGRCVDGAPCAGSTPSPFGSWAPIC